VFNLVKGAKSGPVAPSNPWNGSTLEWTLPATPSLENFDEEPVIKENPYDYK
jgi:cytochrome c oxidase subunit 1